MSRFMRTPWRPVLFAVVLLSARFASGAPGALSAEGGPVRPRTLAAASTHRAAADSARVPVGLGVQSAPVSHAQGVPMIGVNDLARLFGAAKFWRSDVRKLVLRRGEHRLTFTAQNPFVLVDDRTVRLDHEVLTRGGELQIPVDLVRVLPQDGSWPRLAYDADSRQVRVAPPAGFVGAPRIEIHGAVTQLVIPAEHAGGAEVVGQSRARFRLRVAGGLVGALPDSLPDEALVRDLNVVATPNGMSFEIALDPAASGWRLERDRAGGRVTLTFSRIANGYQPFASEGAPGPRVLRTIVLDAGHGGSDIGVREAGAEEKTLTLELARLVADELQKRAGVRVILTRHDDRDVRQDERAELANRAHADAVLSLHFGVFPDVRAHGPRAWCVPARAADATPAAAGLVALQPWRDVAFARAVESRGLAESVTAALERRGIGPALVRERMSVSLIGVQPPGILLECGVLSNPEERERLLAPGGMRVLARAIAEGVLAWQRND